MVPRSPHLLGSRLHGPHKQVVSRPHRPHTSSAAGRPVICGASGVMGSACWTSWFVEGRPVMGRKRSVTEGGQRSRRVGARRRRSGRRVPGGGAAGSMELTALVRLGRPFTRKSGKSVRAMSDSGAKFRFLGVRESRTNSPRTARAGSWSSVVTSTARRRAASGRFRHAPAAVPAAYGRADRGRTRGNRSPNRHRPPVWPAATTAGGGGSKPRVIRPRDTRELHLDQR